MSWGWRKILQVRSLVRPFIWSQIGDGKNTFAWFDNWPAASPLSNLISNRDIYRAGLGRDARVSDIFFDGSWVWPTDWLVKYPPLANIVVPNLTNATDCSTWLNRQNMEDICVILIEYFDRLRQDICVILIEYFDRLRQVTLLQTQEETVMIEDIYYIKHYYIMNSPSNDEWEQLLDIDDSDLQLTPVLHPCNRHEIVEDVGEDEDFNRGPWLSAIEYVKNNGGIVSGCLGDIKKNLNKGKLEQVISIVKSCTPNVLCDFTVTLKDLSVFSPKSSIHYLKITMRNVVKVFHKDTFVGNGSGNPDEMIENLT
ncbi:reverse transcriptase zinc-binding domain-containing protein [Artemisia annua]|uniref:Reverse transcriptase zinc-binding domain-containing protein n=1 Tax=Artemisia annua TaxID=35608 RepID=A0A2U1PZG3_ARTAN|nr:reverse transcriptase zinc-binding domain-containing protein [Artemisia annua]